MPRTRRQKFIVYRRELFIRLKAFQFFLFTFVITSLIGASLLMVEFDLNFLHAVYESVSLMFFASSLDYPVGKFFFEIMWILYPLFGLILLADGLSGIGVTLKFGDPSTKEWNEEMAKVISDHIIVVGVGNVGYNVIKDLVSKDLDLIVVDKFDEKGREEEYFEFQTANRIPTIDGDASKDGVLEKANIKDAAAIVVLINDDLLNLKIGLLAKELNPKIKVILRMFDLGFGKTIQEKLGIDEIFSTSYIAAPVVVSTILPKKQKASPEKN